MLGTQHRSCPKDNRSTQIGSLCAVVCGHPHKREVRKKKMCGYGFSFSQICGFSSVLMLSQLTLLFVKEQLGGCRSSRVRAPLSDSLGADNSSGHLGFHTTYLTAK